MADTQTKNLLRLKKRLEGVDRAVSRRVIVDSHLPGQGSKAAAALEPGQVAPSRAQIFQIGSYRQCVSGQAVVLNIRGNVGN